MWLGKGENGGNSKETLFNDLYQEIKSAAPSAQLTYPLRCRVERCDRDTRQVICSRTKEGCSPLFVASKKGNVEIVEYLITVCGANVEQRGLYEVPDDRSVHNVTPLWCAAVAGKVKVVEVLVKHGADVNSVSDTGSTPVRSACFMTHLDIVKLLVNNCADIQRPNYNGGTCLINSVQSVELCEFLLQNGANVNAQDIQNKTALHYSIQEHRFETTKLLLQYGADPFLESRYKDDALQTACMKGAAEIFEYLIDHIPYNPERVASAFELLGSTFLDEHHDVQKTFQYWGAACDLRDKFGLIKNVLPPKIQFRMTREFMDRSELESLDLDLEALRMQSLLICERILGTRHKDMIFRLMFRGAAYADSLQYQYCIDLWRYALELRVAKDSILLCDTCYTAQALVKLYLDLHERHSQGVLNVEVRIEDVVGTIELLVRDLSQCAELLRIAPHCRRQQDSYDKVLRIITHLLYLVTRLPAREDLTLDIKRKIHAIIHTLNPKTTNGDSLLHLSVMKNNTLKSQNLFDDGHYSFFPSFDVAKLLVECGANVNAVNASYNTPLHNASTSNNYRLEIVELLLASGSHIDLRNGASQRPVDLLRAIPGCKINWLQFVSLKCLAATVIVKNNVSYRGEVPGILEEFVEAH
ncbi:hypothetical protein TCAL_00144 [Tigriopus californicus]|uniref:Uncharacterized protein n=1 Tax=Tigriopus californicus TaxID=6832 RepID=A0A553PI87_TIGCA|nr:protein fem-1 homolog C-like [Tigriopus californicus]TRY77395.1 hypothetical protein TCAL_00144 [Tigriopus californicus]|eukprot:TCALIF_00144-PA protein Name:"Similar to fem1c Protein fem-1 homolog C (Xenopus laevis)" AED:0.06 eAED:0.06 QI:0/0/0/1/1/1/3/114/640